jgi:predicted DNA-binding transcriptional regulator AlpA
MMVAACAGRVSVDRDDLLTAEQAQERLGVSRATFWALVKRYQVPRYKVPVRGKRVFFKPAELDRLREPVPADSTAEPGRRRA